jgi:hypothetical protein
LCFSAAPLSDLVAALPRWIIHSQAFPGAGTASSGGAFTFPASKSAADGFRARSLFIARLAGIVT